MQFAPIELLSPYFWLGSVRDASNIPWLKSKKISVVINVGSGPGDAKQKDPSIKYHTFHALDSPSYPILSHYPAVKSILQNSFQSGKNVLINCHQGINRSASLGLPYVAEVSNTSMDELIHRFRQHRPILQNSHFVQLLREWDTNRLKS